MSLLSRIIQTLSRLLFPGSLVLGFAAILPFLGLSFDSPSSPLRYLPQAIFLAGLILSAVFRRGRIFFALLMLAITQATLSWLAPRLSPAAGGHLTSTIAVLLPLNFMVLAFLKERGIISPAGRLRLVILGMQATAACALCLPQTAFIAVWLDRAFVPEQFTAWSHLPQAGLAAFVLAAVILTGYLLSRYRSVESGLLWALASAFVAFRLNGRGQAVIFWSAAGAILLVALLETSYKMAYHDELTQLPSRRALNEALMKLPDWYTVAMVDVDHFKKFNDSYGHAAGDQALRLVASRLARVAGGGRAYRYGGEEFAVLFVGRPTEDVFVYLDRLRRVIEQTTFTVRGKDRRKGNRGKGGGRMVKRETNVTVSIGVASSDGDHLATAEVMKAADQALYRAKAKGRNCTVCATLRKGAGSAQLSMRTIGAG